MVPFKEKQLSQKLDPTAFKALFKTNPYRHAAAIFQNWVIIVTTAILSEQAGTLWIYPLAVVVIGARMHAQAILMHDAAHYRFLKNRYWNDLLTNFTCAYLIFTTLDKYRQNHLAHHQHLNTEHDPDWAAKIGVPAFTFPKTKRAFIFTLLSYLLLYRGLRDALWFLKRFGGKTNSKRDAVDSKWMRVGFTLCLIAALTLLGWWKYFLLYWLLPYFSTLFMFQYIRSVAEHFGELDYDHPLGSTRTVKPTLFEKLLIAPHNVAYHLEHHLFPGVPFYNLPKLHRMLMDEPDYSKGAHITEGYARGLMNELGK